MVDVQEPPHDRGAESAVLGSLILDPSAIKEVSGILDPSDFYVNAYRDTYKAIQDLKAIKVRKETKAI